MLLEQPPDDTVAPALSSAPEEKFLTRAQAARYLGVPVSTIYQWARTGRLPCIATLGGHLRFSRADLDAAKATRPRAARRSRAHGQVQVQVNGSTSGPNRANHPGRPEAPEVPEAPEGH